MLLILLDLLERVLCNLPLSHKHEDMLEELRNILMEKTHVAALNLAQWHKVSLRKMATLWVSNNFHRLLSRFVDPSECSHRYSQLGLKNAVEDLDAYYQETALPPLISYSSHLTIMQIALPDAQNAPLAAQNAPLAVQNAPLDAQNAPLAAQNAPPAAQNAPPAAQNAPSAAQNAPSAAQNAPSAAQNAPPAAQNAPPAAQNAPPAAQNAPPAANTNRVFSHRASHSFFNCANNQRRVPPRPSTASSNFGMVRFDMHMGGEAFLHEGDLVRWVFRKPYKEGGYVLVSTPSMIPYRGFLHPPPPILYKLHQVKWCERAECWVC
jgi:hypothetical protein